MGVVIGIYLPPPIVVHTPHPFLRFWTKQRVPPLLGTPLLSAHTTIEDGRYTPVTTHGRSATTNTNVCGIELMGHVTVTKKVSISIY